jgi:hypothetical protein
VGPLLPHFRYRPDLLDDLFARLKGTGIRQVYVEHINLTTNNTRQRLLKVLANESAETKNTYTGATTEDHRHTLDDIVAELLTKHGLAIRLGEVLRHNNR